jgi:hypothetical protein
VRASFRLAATILALDFCFSIQLSAFAQSAQREKPMVPSATAKSALVPFETSPFPYRGNVPADGKPFLDVENAGRLGHTSPRGGVYWEDQTYSDRRALLYIPKGFDPRKPALIVVYFHGNLASLERDVRGRQQIPRQLSESGLNAVLVAPQFAVDALDSSAGRFWEPGLFGQFISEAEKHLARLYGDESARSAFNKMPIAFVAYSGGYMPAISAIQEGGINNRLHGIILMDALFGEIDKFATWLTTRPPAFFLSAYTRASKTENMELQRLLTEQKIAFDTTLVPRLRQGDISFLAASPDTSHLEFMSHAWVNDPLKILLAKIKGYPRGR